MLPTLSSLFPPRRPRPLLGIVPGEGVGPKLGRAARVVAEAAFAKTGRTIEIWDAGSAGLGADRRFVEALPAEVERFCDAVLDEGGTVLCGPGGGRFRFALRERFGLFCEVVPVRPAPGLRVAGPLRPERLEGVDLLLVRDVASGPYYGAAEALPGRGLSFTSRTSEPDVRRVMDVAARLAAARSGRLDVATYEAAMPGVGALWARVGREVAAERAVACRVMTADHVAWRLGAEPGGLDVVVTDNLFGDVLGGVAAVVLGSRGLAHGGSFAPNGAAIYQTSHGAAADLVGRDVVNPGAQLLALAMALRESLDCPEEAACIEAALDAVWARGVRTADLAGDAPPVGTRSFVGSVLEQIRGEAGGRVFGR